MLRIKRPGHWVRYQETRMVRTAFRSILLFAGLAVAAGWSVNAQDPAAGGQGAQSAGAAAGRSAPPPPWRTGGVRTAPEAAERFKNFRPVTEATLLNPDPADWIHWRRTHDAWGFSPLKQIDRSNVDELQLVWVRPLGGGASMQPTPLVYQGVLYIPQPWGLVQAYDGVSGDLLWQYQRKFDYDPDTYFLSRLRGLGIIDDKIIVPTTDAHLVALDARSGKVVWEQKVADYTLGYRYTSGPLIAKGKIFQGMTGCERYKDDICFITAHDPATGKELWRTSTVQRPGDPGPDTWSGLPLNRRAGSDVWITGSFDPKLNLIYYSTANPKPWARVSRKTDGDNLYTNSTLALDPDTGRMVWHYQFTPGESLDIDDAYENMLVDYDGRQSLLKMGKLGILWELDRRTGRFIRSTDLGFQNVVEIDPTSGKVSFNAAMVPKKDEPVVGYCPGAFGVRNFRATAYHPDTGAIYIPIHPHCASSIFGDAAEENALPVYFYRDSKFTGQRFTSPGGGPHPAMPKGFAGMYVAMEARTGRILWRHQRVGQPTAAALTTAGGLMIGGEGEFVFALDAASGKQLWQTRLMTGVVGYPVTYAIGGTQYVAFATSNRPTSGAALCIFAIPQKSRGALL
jgi:alcohol dehydrogenase (cytochrome c)